MMNILRFGSFFLWLIGAAGLYGVYATYGLPHVIWNFTFLANGDRHNPFAHRYYTSCEYVGYYGVFRVPAQNANCPWFKFFKEKN